MSSSHRLYYIHDPMCSWCWGFSPTLTHLRAALPENMAFSYLLGGLAPDSDQPMPEDMRQQLQATWRRIQQRIPGTRFNFAFWEICRPRRSTWPACRAVIAARKLSPEREPDMIQAIQHAYYLNAQNPSDDSTLIALAESLGLDGAAFTELLKAPATQTAFDEEMRFGRSMGADSFPSLRLEVNGAVWPIAVDYLDSNAMLGQITALTAHTA